MPPNGESTHCKIWLQLFFTELTGFVCNCDQLYFSAIDHRFAENTAGQNMIVGMLRLFHDIKNVNADSRCLCEKENGNSVMFPPRPDPTVWMAFIISSYCLCCCDKALYLEAICVWLIFNFLLANTELCGASSRNKRSSLSQTKVQ